MVNKNAKASTARGKRLQATTIATMNLAIGSETIDLSYDFDAGGFLDIAMLCYRQSEKKPAKTPFERFTVTWNHVIDKETPNFKEMEHLRLEKVDQPY